MTKTAPPASEPVPSVDPGIPSHGSWTRVLETFAVFVALVLALTTCSRAGLFLWQSSRVAETGGAGYIFLQGLRFDLVALGLLLALPCLLGPWLLASRFTFRATCVSMRAAMAALVAGFFFMEVSTPSFIEEYGTRPNYLFVEYLIYPKEVLATLWGAYPLQLLFSVVAVPLIWFAAFRFVSKGRRQVAPLRVRAALCLSLVMGTACFAAARSTTDHRAVNPSTVCFSSDPLVNTLPLNSLYSASYGFYEMAKNESSGKPVYGDLPYEEVVEIVRAGTGYALDEFVDPAVPTMHFQRATRERERPLNFVIMLQESLGAEFVGAMGGLPLTPNLDKLLDEGMTLDNLYATGTRSARGIEAVVAGFLPTPSRSTVKLPRSQSGFFTIACLLERQGYETSFLYGGESQFDNMARFFSGNGFETIIDHKDFENPEFEGSWGVSDQDLFRRAHEEFDAMGDKPFFSLVFSSSNHSPWDFPEQAIELYEQPQATRNNAVKYADHALGQFFEDARASSYWENTVFLVVADHNSRVYGAEQVPVERFHIPGVFLGGSVAPQHLETMASQVDMIPTALSLIGMSASHLGVGLDLTDPVNQAAPGRAFLQYNNSNLYLTPDKAVLHRPGVGAQVLDSEGNVLAGELGDAEAEMVRVALGYALWPQMSYRKRDYCLEMASF
ncbi:MAG: phosphoglycerol transferase MdoB-like AlkP superfamily enzyme [Planctomycetota bacterium]|jgi:phosphoglycerol transferase MdoB-like AlkP superfamily enzyme